MDQAILEGLLTTIRDALSSNRRQDVALPKFDPSTSNGEAVQCDNEDKLGSNGNGSASTWYETWERQAWESLSKIISLSPEKKNLSEELRKAVSYTSDSADSYSEYAIEKVRLLKNTKIVFSEAQLIALVCGGIREVNVREASLKSSVTTVSELIDLFSAYAKTRKRSAEQAFESLRNTYDYKRYKPMNTDDTLVSKKCFRSKKRFLPSQCLDTNKLVQDSPAGVGLKKCTVCKK